MRTTLALAMSQLGVTERTGKNDGTPAERYMDGDQLPWCAGFLLWCNRQSEDPKIGVPKDRWRLRSVAALEEWCREAGILLGPRVRPAPNDLIFFGDRGTSDAGPGRHAGIVEKVVRDRVIGTIEGNVTNSVRRVTHSLVEGGRVSGFARISDL